MVVREIVTQQHIVGEFDISFSHIEARSSDQCVHAGTEIGHPA
jgi:hypothetical protein